MTGFLSQTPIAENMPSRPAAQKQTDTTRYRAVISTRRNTLTGDFRQEMGTIITIIYFYRHGMSTKTDMTKMNLTNEDREI